MAEAIREATEQALEFDPSVFVIGEGVGDPKQIFGTTRGLRDRFPNRIFDSPISENGVTGVCVGAAVAGLRPLLIHQRMDFALYGADQLINNAAKWHSMFGGRNGTCPLVVRMIVGRGWGAGNQHSQNLTALFAHVPGLKVVVPANPHDAKGLLLSALSDSNPVVFVEHRWLHEQRGDVPEQVYRTPIGVADRLRRGDDLTIVASGHSVGEALKAADFWADAVDCEVLNLRTIRPLDVEGILSAVNQTGRLIVVDDAWTSFGVSAEIMARVAEYDFGVQMARVACPDRAAPSSPHLIWNYWPTAWSIAEAIGDMTGFDRDLSPLIPKPPHDVPPKFGGPF